MAEHIGPYEILGKLGSGGMGTVYRARDSRTDALVALKVLKDEVAEDPELARRFEQEANTLRKLDHENIVRLLEYGADGDAYYIAMELVEGEALQQRLRREGRLPEPEVRRIGIAVSAALEAAHGQRIIHRDIKPGNILLGADGSVKVSDFGVARVLDETRRTRTGTFLGSLAYAAPEAFDRPADERSDLYSLGIVLYECITGVVPFRADTPVRLIELHRRQPFDVVPAENVAPGLVPFLHALLAKEPADRIGSARMLRTAFDQPVFDWLETVLVNPQASTGVPKTTARRRVYGLAAIPLVALLVLAGSTYMVRGNVLGAGLFWFDGQGGTSSAVPLPAGTVGEVTALSAGAQHTCALKDAGVWCWGGGDHGQLGNGNSINKNVPVAVAELASKVSGLSAGTYHTCAIRDTVWCWGANEFGELGDGSTNSTNVPVAVSTLGNGVSVVGAGTAGGAHTCAVREGAAWCWGWNNYGELGDGTRNHSNVPVEVLAMASGVTDISAGSGHSCAVREAGLWCWGSNGFGQLGDGTGGLNTDSNNSWVPVAVVGLTSGVSAVSTGRDHTCAVKDGGVWCWGNNSAGQLGDGTTTDSNLPVAVSGLTSDVSAISAGNGHTCALKGGAVLCWGYNEKGQLGNNSTTDSHVPTAVLGLASGVSAVSAGEAHTCATDGGTVWCWGDNAVGQLGNASATSSPAPVAVFGFGTVATTAPAHVKILSIEPPIGQLIALSDKNPVSVTLEYQVDDAHTFVGWGADLCTDAGCRRAIIGGIDVEPDSSGTVTIPGARSGDSFDSQTTAATICSVTAEVSSLAQTVNLDVSDQPTDGSCRLAQRLPLELFRIEPPPGRPILSDSIIVTVKYLEGPLRYVGVTYRVTREGNCWTGIGGDFPATIPIPAEEDGVAVIAIPVDPQDVGHTLWGVDLTLRDEFGGFGSDIDSEVAEGCGS